MNYNITASTSRSTSSINNLALQSPTALVSPLQSRSPSPEPISAMAQTICELLANQQIEMDPDSCEILYRTACQIKNDKKMVDFLNITKNQLPGRPEPKVHMFLNQAKKVVNFYIRDRSRSKEEEIAEENNGTVKIHKRNICRLSLDFSNEADGVATAGKVSQLTINIYNGENQDYVRWAFNNEVKILKALSGHENILKLYDAAVDYHGSISGQRFRKSVMYVETFDSNLDSYILNVLHKSPPNMDSAALETAKRQIMKKILLGFDHIHKRGFIHGDPKTDNMLIKSLVNNNDEPGPSDNCKVVISDFDQSYNAAEESQRKGIRGSFMMLGPEGFQSWFFPRDNEDAITKKTDMWSIGIMFSEVLTGNLPRWSALLSALCCINILYPRFQGLIPVSNTTVNASEEPTIRDLATLKPLQDMIQEASKVSLRGKEDNFIVEHLSKQVDQLNDLITKLDPRSIAELFGDLNYTKILFELIDLTIYQIESEITFLRKSELGPRLDSVLKPKFVQLTENLKNQLLLSWKALETLKMPEGLSMEQQMVWRLLRPNQSQRPTAETLLTNFS